MCVYVCVCVCVCVCAGNKIQAGIFFTLWAIFIIMGSINVSTDNSLNFLK